MECENLGECSVMEWRPSLWRRIVDRLLWDTPPSEDFYDHECVPLGGDMVHCDTTVTFGWRGIFRLIALRRLSVQVRIVTKEPVNTVLTKSHTFVG